MKALTILIVEDEKIVARDLQATLERAGYHVPVLVASGEEAILQAERLRPDLVLMDIVLQGQMDGITAASRIRQQFGIPVIYLSSYGDQAMLERAKSTEPIGYVLKPYEEKDLLTNLEVALHQFQASRQREEKALLASEARFRVIFSASPLGIGLMNRQGRCVDSNPALQRMLGYGPKELRELSLSDYTHPENRAAEARLFEELIGGQSQSYEFEKRIIRKDGEISWLRVHACHFPHAAAEGAEASFTLHMVEDISDAKVMEEQLLRAQRMEVIGTFTSGLAHNLNNILTPVTVGLDLLRPVCAEEPARSTLDTMETSLYRGSAIVRQLLGFGRGIEEHKVVFEPGQLLGEVHALVRELFPKTVLTEVRVPAGLWTLEGDSNQLHQALLNLCANARDAMPNGGRLCLGAENASVDERLARLHPGVQPGPYVVLAVSDTGLGISPEIMGKLFSPFFTTKPFGKGTGLGLSTTLGIVKRHKGFIDLESQVGKGTQFRLYLPALTTAPE